jgi:2-hydroxychromene-2-carboxylate isomerase
VNNCLDFYFDFSSSYTCVGLTRIQELAARHSMALRWLPISLGAIFRERGHSPPARDTPKGQYIYRDVERCAAEAGLAWRWPRPFPFNSIPAARGFLWVEGLDPLLATRYAVKVFEASFVGGRDLSSLEELSRVAAGLGLDPGEFASGIQDPDIKARLVSQTNEAAARGVFGAPTLIVGNELFWGADRICQLDAWLRNGRQFRVLAQARVQ